MSQQTYDNIPQIRFRGCKGEWEKKALSELCVRTGSLAFDASLPCIEFEDINSGEGTLNKNIYKKEAHKAGLTFQAGDVLFGKLRPYLCNVFCADFRGIATGDFWVLRSAVNIPQFLYQYMYTKKWQTETNKCSGSKMPRADWNYVSKCTYSIPSRGEQERIAACFEKIDALVSRQRERVERLRKLKAALLDKLFPKPGHTAPELRVNGCTGEWEEKKLSEFLKLSKRKNNDLAYTIYDVLSVSQDYGVVNQIEFQGRSYAGASLTNYDVLLRGEVVYTKSPLKEQPFGIIKANRHQDGIVSTLYAVYTCQDCTPDFVECYFSDTERLNAYLRPIVHKGAKNTMNVSDEDALTGLVLFPSLSEQRAIASLLMKYDRLTSLHEAKLAKLRQLKLSLLDKMFV